MSSHTTPIISIVYSTSLQSFSVITDLVPIVTIRSSHAALLPPAQENLLLSLSSLLYRAHPQIRVHCALAILDVMMLLIILAPQIVTKKQKGNKLCANISSL